ncbi:MAG: hypothetical protein K8I30_03370 [Anaerolineae bacterium]|nr:hypothetical protein [Anaerolineae bacterium]
MATQDEQTARAQLVQQKYMEMLLKLPHVVGVGIGFVKRGGVQTGEVGLVVMVDQKISALEIDPVDKIPTELDDVPVDVQEIGQPTAQ